MKVDLFYLKSENKLYAFTTYKPFKESFMSQRNMDLFIQKTEKMDKILFQAFMSKNRNLKLVELPLYDGYEYLNIIGTIEEDNKLSESCEQIDINFAYMQSYFQSIPLNEKVLNLIYDLTNVVKKVESSNHDQDVQQHDVILEVNTFKLFYYLFRNTFAITDNDERLYNT